jgi:hypothetical protein
MAFRRLRWTGPYLRKYWAISQACRRTDRFYRAKPLPSPNSPDAFPGSPHRISAQIVPTLVRPIARAAPRDKSMSRPRVNGPRSLIVTTVEAPVRGFVSFTRVPNGSFLCAAVRPSGRNAWPLAVPEPTLYWVAFIDPLGQPPWVGAAMATLPNQVETRSTWIASMSLTAMIDLPIRLPAKGRPAFRCESYFLERGLPKAAATSFFFMRAAGLPR